MIELTDRSPLDAAIREAREEIGLRVPAGAPAVALEPVVVRSSGVVIQPFWVRLATSPRLRASADEVEAILRVPLLTLAAPGTLRPIPHPRRPDEQTPAYIWRGQVIWGATARMIDDLLRRYEGGSAASK